MDQDSRERERRVNPLHYSLMESVPTFAGAEKSFALVNLSFTAAMVMASQTWQFFVPGVIAHVLLVWMTKRDPLTRVIYFRYVRQGSRYDPWPRTRQNLNSRPRGFARGALC